MFFFKPKIGDLVKLKIDEAYSEFHKIYDGTFGILLRIDNKLKEKEKYIVFSTKTLKEIKIFETELKKLS